jgi:hypothetical protein
MIRLFKKPANGRCMFCLLLRNTTGYLAERRKAQQPYPKRRPTLSKQYFFLHLPRKMEPIERSETSALKPQTPGKYPKENKLQNNIPSNGSRILNLGLLGLSYRPHVQTSSIKSISLPSVCTLNPLALELDIYSSAHRLCKMCIFYEPRRVPLGNTRHFVEE